MANCIVGGTRWAQAIAKFRGFRLRLHTPVNESRQLYHGVAGSTVETARGKQRPPEYTGSASTWMPTRPLRGFLDMLFRCRRRAARKRPRSQPRAERPESPLGDQAARALPVFTIRLWSGTRRTSLPLGRLRYPRPSAADCRIPSPSPPSADLHPDDFAPNSQTDLIISARQLEIGHLLVGWGWAGSGGAWNIRHAGGGRAGDIRETGPEWVEGALRKTTLNTKTTNGHGAGRHQSTSRARARRRICSERLEGHRATKTLHTAMKVERSYCRSARRSANAWVDSVIVFSQDMLPVSARTSSPSYNEMYL